MDRPEPPPSGSSGRGLRPETLRLLRQMAATTAVTDSPVTLTRAEAVYLLDIADSPSIVPEDWVRALESGYRYTIIAACRARRSGFEALADWVETSRSRPIAMILDSIRPDRTFRDRFAPGLG